MTEQHPSGLDRAIIALNNGIANALDSLPPAASARRSPDLMVHARIADIETVIDAARDAQIAAHESSAPRSPHTGFAARVDADIDGQDVTITLTLGQVKRVVVLTAGAITADPSQADDMALLLALQAEGGREQERLRAEGYQ